MKKQWHKITLEELGQCQSYLKAGDKLLLTGWVYTARDMAHKALVKLIEKNRPLPVSLKDKVIYLTGPTPTPPGKVIGAAGPTTTRRMANFIPYLLKAGLLGIIGKGTIPEELISAFKKYQGIYFVTFGGLGALLSSWIKKCQIIAYPQYGAEAMRKLEIEDFPVIVALDSEGGYIFSQRNKN
jgi:fumarate hydratase subunit beta